MLLTKLSSNSDAILPSANVKSVLLYEGSITVFDSRMCAFDIGTCLEVLLCLYLLSRFKKHFLHLTSEYHSIFLIELSLETVTLLKFPKKK